MFDYRKRKRLLNSRKESHSNKLSYEVLELRTLLASTGHLIDDGQALMNADVFAESAVSIEHILERASRVAFVPNQVIVAVEVPADKGRSAELLSQVNWGDWTGYVDTRVIKNLMTVDRGLNQRIALVQLDLGFFTDPLSVVRKLSNRQEVLWSSPNFVHTGPDPRNFAPDDPLFESQYQHVRMQNHLAWDVTLGSPGVKIAVTDDGVSLNHPDLASNIWVNPGEIPGNGIDDDGNGFVDDVRGWDFSSGNNDPSPNDAANSHGTHIAGIAAGRINNGIGGTGTAGRATIMPLQFFGGTGQWTAAIINSTYVYAANNGAKIVITGYDLNTWIGDPVYLAGLQYMYNAGVLHFVSAGNSNLLEPAVQVFEQSLLVASTTSTDARSSFSNYGSGIDISAPGSSILSTVLNGNHELRSGTSMAASNAAAVAALIWSANPGWNRDQVANRLLFHSDVIGTFSGLMGSGRANSHRALTGVDATPIILSVPGLPLPNSTTQTWNIRSFGIKFRQFMDPLTVNINSNYELREAGLDNLFDTSDDVILNLTRSNYSVGSNTVQFSIQEGLLGPGSYRFRMVGNVIRNPFGVLLDGDTALPGAADGYDHLFTLTPSLIADPSLGSQVYSQTHASSIDFAGQQRTYLLKLDPGQKITAFVESRGSLNPTMTLTGPSGNLLATGTPLGNRSLISDVPVTVRGAYKFQFAGLTNSIGDFDFRLYLNASIELESLGGTANNSSATAQDIDSSALAFGTRGADRLSVTGGNPAEYSFKPLVSEGFESGILSSAWQVESSSAIGKVGIVNSPPAAFGNHSLLMHSRQDNTSVTNRATWTINLAGRYRPILRFWEISYNDEVHAMPASFSNFNASDGVAFSVDGTTYYRIWTPVSSDPFGSWREQEIDLAQVATSLGLQLGDTLRIRFQQHDNFPFPADGRAYDQISISVATNLTDYYSFTLADLEKASLRLVGETSSGVSQIDVFDSRGARLATGNASNLIPLLQDTTNNGVRDRYFVKISSLSKSYNLTITRNAIFDSEPNDTAATAQSIDGVLGVFGYEDQFETPDVFKFNVSAGEFVSFTSFLPGAGPFQFVNALAYGDTLNANLGNHYIGLSLRNASGGLLGGFPYQSPSFQTIYLHVYAPGVKGEYFVQRNVINNVVESGLIPLVGASPVDITFSQSFVDPVVIVGPPRNANNQMQIIINPVQVTSTGFRISISNWSGGATGNVAEQISYLVFERGLNILPNGNIYVAGSRTVGSSVFEPVELGHLFGNPPLIFGSILGSEQTTPRAVRFRNVGQSSFEVITQFNEAGIGASNDLIEVNYVALMPMSAYSFNGMEMMAERMNATHANSNFSFSYVFSGLPNLVAGIQTFNESDPAVLRLSSLFTSSGTLYIQEETSLDAELLHAQESVGFIAVRPGGANRQSENPIIRSPLWWWPSEYQFEFKGKPLRLTPKVNSIYRS